MIVPPTHTGPHMSEEEFCSYVKSKAYDVISTGQFKRHLLTSRDKGDNWALQCCAGVSKVQAKTKQLTSCIAALSGKDTALLHGICRDVMNSAQPPVKISGGISTCLLTGEKVQHCLDLTRPGKKNTEVCVHPRFWYFFIFLWFCAKIEYIVRSHTKQWLQSVAGGADDRNFTALCERFTEDNHAYCKLLHRLFTMAHEYVSTSLQMYAKHQQPRPVLVSTASYLEGTSDVKEVPASCLEGTCDVKDVDPKLGS